MSEPTVHQPEQRTVDEQPRDRPAPAAPANAADGVAVRRLLAVAILTPAQAALLVLDLVNELENLRRDEHSPSRISDRSATVSDSGRLRLVPESAPGHERRAAEQDAESWRVAAVAATTLARRLFVNAGRGASHRRSESATLAGHIDGPIADVAELSDRLRAAAAEIIGSHDESKVRRTREELVALVAASNGHPPPVDGGTLNRDEPAELPLPAPRGDILAPRGWRPSSRRVWHRRRRIRTRRTILVALVAVLLLAAGWWGVPRAWTELQHGWHAVLTPAEPSRQLEPVSPPARARSAGAPAEQEPRPKAVTAPAPKSASPVRRVSITHAEGACAPGRVCPVRVDVDLEPAGAPRTVSWSLLIIDRCTGKVRGRPGVSMTAQGGWREVYGISRPELPAGKALAVIAVTGAPARAASTPLLVPGGGQTC